MSRSLWSAALVVVLTVSACSLLNGGGGGGGAGGGTAGPFVSGYASVRRDDRNLLLTDERDVNAPSQLTTTGGVSTPSFSRDGRVLVFSRKVGQDSELVTVAVSGGTPSTVLRSTPNQQNLRTPAFSPDGTRIAFAYDENQVSSSIGLVNVDGSNFTRLIGGGALAYGSPTWFPDGQSLLVSTGNAGLMQTQVERVNVATGQTTGITNTLGNEALAIAGRLVVSPDGTRAIFDGRVSSNATRIFLLTLASRTVTRLRSPPATVNDSSPTWIDAQTIAFSSDEGGADQVYRQSLTASSPTLALPLAIEPAFFAPPASTATDAGVDGGSPDGGP